MLPYHLEAFNDALLQFQKKFPSENWSIEFKEFLLNDFSFFSARIEDPKLKYGDTIRFLKNESIRAVNIRSLMGVAQHQTVLRNLLEHLEGFSLSEESIKGVHAALMDSPYAWESEFKPELVGNYRNIPIVGSRQPYFTYKEYAPHFNLQFIVPAFLDLCTLQLNDIDNSIEEKHLIKRLADFHNKFLNEIHPFADGNGRVCRILMGAIMMKNNCPPVFPKIIDHEDQVKYISTIVECELVQSNSPLIKYFSEEMSAYLIQRLD